MSNTTTLITQLREQALIVVDNMTLLELDTFLNRTGERQVLVETPVPVGDELVLQINLIGDLRYRLDGRGRKIFTEASKKLIGTALKEKRIEIKEVARLTGLAQATITNWRDKRW